MTVENVNYPTCLSWR